jgi:hypothetical protein
VPEHVSCFLPIQVTRASGCNVLLLVSVQVLKVTRHLMQLTGCNVVLFVACAGVQGRSQQGWHGGGHSAEVKGWTYLYTVACIWLLLSPTAGSLLQVCATSG